VSKIPKHFNSCNILRTNYYLSLIIIQYTRIVYHVLGTIPIWMLDAGALTYSQAIEEISKLFRGLLEFIALSSVHDLITFTTTHSINSNSFLHIHQKFNLPISVKIITVKVEQESTLAFSKQPANEICNVPFYSSQKPKILRGYSSLKVILDFQFHYV